MAGPNLAFDFKAIPPLDFRGLVRGDPEKEKPAEESGKQGFIVRLNKRRFASMRYAEQALSRLPEAEGEALILIQSGFFDLSSLLVKLLEKLGSPCLSLKVATLSMSKRNVQELLAIFDLGRVKQMALMTADVFRKKDAEIFDEAALEFQKRGQRIAAARSHAKVISILLDNGQKWILEGSANLRTNRNQENLSIIRHGPTYDYFDSWLDRMIDKHAVTQS